MFGMRFIRFDRYVPLKNNENYETLVLLLKRDVALVNKYVEDEISFYSIKKEEKKGNVEKVLESLETTRVVVTQLLRLGNVAHKLIREIATRNGETDFKTISGFYSRHRGMFITILHQMFDLKVKSKKMSKLRKSTKSMISTLEHIQKKVTFIIGLCELLNKFETECVEYNGSAPSIFPYNDTFDMESIELDNHNFYEEIGKQYYPVTRSFFTFYVALVAGYYDTIKGVTRNEFFRNIVMTGLGAMYQLFPSAKVRKHNDFAKDETFKRDGMALWNAASSPYISPFYEMGLVSISVSKLFSIPVSKYLLEIPEEDKFMNYLNEGPEFSLQQKRRIWRKKIEDLLKKKKNDDEEEVEGEDDEDEEGNGEEEEIKNNNNKDEEEKGENVIYDVKNTPEKDPENKQEKGKEQQEPEFLVKKDEEIIKIVEAEEEEEEEVEKERVDEKEKLLKDEEDEEEEFDAEEKEPGRTTSEFRKPRDCPELTRDLVTGEISVDLFEYFFKRIMTYELKSPEIQLRVIHNFGANAFPLERVLKCASSHPIIFGIKETFTSITSIFSSKKAPREFDGSIIFHCHGGGFIAMDSHTHEMYLRKWSKQWSMPIISVDYTNAPGAKYPTQPLQCYLAYKFVVTNFKRLFGCELKRIIVAGDSAGGNLCTILISLSIADGFRVPDGAIINYPTYITAFEACPSRVLAYSDPLVSKPFLELVLGLYPPEGYPYKGLDPFLSPIVTPGKVLSKFPPCYITVCSLDPLFDDGVTMAKKLDREGVKVLLSVHDAAPHGFLNFCDILSEARKEIEFEKRWIHWLLDVYYARIEKEEKRKREEEEEEEEEEE